MLGARASFLLGLVPRKIQRELHREGGPLSRNMTTIRGTSRRILLVVV